MITTYAPIGIGTDDLPEPLPRGCWDRVGKRLVELFTGVGMTAAAVATAVFNRDPSAPERVSTYVAGGIGLQLTFDAALAIGTEVAVRDRRKSIDFDSLPAKKACYTAHKIYSSVLTQPALFAVSQMYYDVHLSHVPEGTVNAIFALGGAWLARQLTRISVVDMESSVPTPFEEQRTFKEAFLPSEYRQAAGAMAALGCGAIRVLSPDPVAEFCAGFFGPFFIAKIVGEKVAGRVHGKVRTLEREGELLGTKWRRVRSAVDTAGGLVPICLLIPLSEPWTFLAGGAAGLFTGMASEGFRERLCSVPRKDLSELRDHPYLPVEHLAYKSYRVAWAALAELAFPAFVVYQEGWALKDDNQKRALGVAYGSCALASAAAYWAFRSRPPEESSRLHDWVFTTLLLNPRLPVLAFFVGTSTINIKSSDLAINSDLSYQIAADVAWASYGWDMGIRLVKDLQNWEGDPRDIQTLFAANVLITAKNVLRGDA